MLADRTTLTRFLIGERRRHPEASGDLDALVLDVVLAVKATSRRVARGVPGDAAMSSVQGERQKKLGMIAKTFSCEPPGGAATRPAWCRRRWRRRTRCPRTIRVASTRCHSIRLMARRTST